MNSSLAIARTKSYRLKRSIIKCFNRYTMTPKIIKNWRYWAFRRALSPWISLHMWAVSELGVRYYLGDDPIDDMILEDILHNQRQLYLPDKIAPDKDLLILDIGAHHGIVAVSMLMHFSKSFLIAIEPNPDAPQYLRKNIEANQLSNRVEIVCSALGEKDDAGFLYRGNKGSWSDTLIPDPGCISGKKVEIKTITSLLAGKKPNLVKCNAEGAEYYIFPQLFNQGIYPDFIILMVHPEFGSVEDLLLLFVKNGYTVNDVVTGKNRPRLHCYLEGSSLIRDI